MQLVESIFSEEDAREIFKIPLSACKAKDRFYLAHSPTGVYAVKSAYVVARELKRKKRKRNIRR